MAITISRLASIKGVLNSTIICVQVLLLRGTAA